MSKKLIAFITTVVVMLAVASPATAQRINVKTNALYWLAMSPNLGVEFRINRHMTFNLEGVVNRVSGFKPYGVSNLSTKGFAFEPEARYWFSARPQAGHFVGLTAVAANYDLQFNDKRHDGDLFGGGITLAIASYLVATGALRLRLALVPCIAKRSIHVTKRSVPLLTSRT